MVVLVLGSINYITFQENFVPVIKNTDVCLTLAKRGGLRGLIMYIMMYGGQTGKKFCTKVFCGGLRGMLT